jgi:hypothetical protein
MAFPLLSLTASSRRVRDKRPQSQLSPKELGSESEWRNVGSDARFPWTYTVLYPALFYTCF